jgi:hypothetical protein
MIVGLLGAGDRPMRDKIRDASIATVVGCAPLGAWLIRNIATAHTATGRGFAVHPARMSHVKALCSTLLAFISPDTSPARVKVVQLVLLTMGVLVSAVAVHGKSRARDRASSFCIAFSSTSVLLVLTYVAFLFISISFFSVSTPLDARLLLPVFVLLVAPVISLAWSLSQALRSRIIWRGFLCAVALLVILNGKRAVAEALDVRANGRGYTSAKWRTSPSIRFVRSLADERKIFSNGPDVIHFLTGRRASEMPSHTLRNGTPNRDYEEELQAMCSDCRNGVALTVYFEDLALWFLPTREELTSKCNLSVLSEVDDGTIYGSQVSDRFPRAVP